MIKNLKEKLGMVLAEALLAVALLAIGATILGYIVTSAISSVALSRDYLIAQNLMTEEIEAVKIIRDTNWLMNPNRTDCWLQVNSVSIAGQDPCVGKVAIGNYIPKQNGNKWSLSLNENAPDLNIADGIAGSEKRYLLCIQQASGRYISAGNNCPINTVASKFYRNVKFTSVPDDDSNAIFDANIQWFEGAKVYSIKQEIKIDNNI